MPPEVLVVASGSGLSRRVAEFGPDLILADPALPIEGAASALEFVREARLAVPVIFVADVEGEEAAVEALQAGAADYLFKGRLARLATAVEHVLRDAACRSEKRQKEEATRISGERHRYFLEQTAEGFYRLDFDPPIPTNLGEDEVIARMYEAGAIAECNQIYAATYGIANPEEMIGMRLVDLHGGADKQENVAALREFVRCGLRHIGVETVERDADGDPVHLLNSSVGLVQDGLYVCCWGTQRDITEQRRAEGLVKASREQLRALIAKMRRAQDDERKRCARQIHDELGQLLTALKLQVRWIEKKLSGSGVQQELNPLLDRAVAASELVDNMIGAVQQLATKIRPGTLDQLGLAAALTASTRRFETHCEIPATIGISEPPPEVSPEIANEMFYICQEALTNVCRHAQAHSVEVSLRQEGGEIVLEVHDDGIGIDQARMRAPASLGLLGMSERALQHGGDVTVGRRAPRGTTVTARIPLDGAPDLNLSEDVADACALS